MTVLSHLCEFSIKSFEVNRRQKSDIKNLYAVKISEALHIERGMDTFADQGPKIRQKVLQ